MIMLSTSSLKTPLFDRATGKDGKRLSSPFARNFNPQEWDAEISGVSNERDLNLYLCARFFGNQTQQLRNGLQANLLTGISRRSALMLALACANRSHFVIDKAFRKMRARRTQGTQREVFHFAEIAKSSLSISPQDNLNADDLNTVIVDSLPYWFAHARSLPEERESPNTDFASLEPIVTAVLSTEAGLGDLWKAALWEGRRLTKQNDKIVFRPFDKSAEKLWYAWQLREESAQLGAALYAAQPKKPHADLERLRGVQAIHCRGQGWKFIVAEPSTEAATELSSSLLSIERTYLGDFLDEKLSFADGVITPRKLVHALWLLKEIGESIHAATNIRRISDYKDVRSLSMRIEKKRCTSLFEKCLGLSFDDAKAVLTYLTLSPDDLQSCFDDGPWFHPLIELDEDTFMIVQTSVSVGSKARFVARALSKLLGSDLTKRNNLGKPFERQVKTRLVKAMARNRLLTDAAIVAEPLDFVREGGEEIDLLLRIGRTIILGEVKCYIAPTVSIERFNYLSRLECAAEQAKRKCLWLEKNFTKVSSQLRIEVDVGPKKFLPIVVLNQRIGSGMEVNGVAITDIDFLELFLSDGGYVSAGLVSHEKTQFIETKMYSNQAEAESQLFEILGMPPALRPFLESIDWVETSFPTASGEVFIQKPQLSERALISPELERLART